MMPLEDERHCCDALPSDVLSGLPENVLDDILMRLPLRDTVRTSILAKRWRYNWCKLPMLTLDQALFPTDNLVTSTIRFTDIMYHLLAFHVGPITKFTLSATKLQCHHKVDSLIYFLSRNGIKHLVLQFSSTMPYKLPSSFFTCLDMQHLRLENCLVYPPPSLTGFDKLISLELHGVSVSSGALQSLISCSPLLEQLVLENSISDDIQINAPKLRYFDFSGHIKYISFEKAPLLVGLSLVETIFSSDAGKYGVESFFEPFPALEYLHFNYCIAWFFAAGSGDMPAKLSSPLNCIKSLCLMGFSLDELVELSFALCLIRSSPYLHHIKITMLSFDETRKPVPDDVVNEIPASFTGVTLNHLRSVTLEGITGTKAEMQVIKVLLDKSRVLVRMLLEPKKGESAEAKLKVVAEITKFERASPKAQVVYTI